MLRWVVIGALSLTGTVALSAQQDCICGSPCDVLLQFQDVDFTETFQACNNLTAGNQFRVLPPGDATLRAGMQVGFENGASVAVDGLLSVQIDAGLACDTSVDQDEDLVNECFDCDDENSGIFPGADDICDGVDNDCDAGTLDGVDDPQLGATCDGTDGDLCHEGTFACTAGSLACSDATGDDLDVCDGLDNDCDPSSADGSEDPQNGASCDGPDSDLCEEGTLACSSGSLECDDLSGDDLDLCDGLDNDCDATSPDGSEDSSVGQPCDGADGDLCIEGTTFCSVGSLDCDDTTGTTTEVCNGLDDDCDGSIDEDLSAADLWEPNDSCGAVVTLPSVGSDQTQMQNAVTIYPQGDADYFRIQATETDSECSCCDMFCSDEDYQLQITLAVPSGAGSYELCAGLDSCAAVTDNCKSIVGGSADSWTFTLDGACGLGADEYDVYVRVQGQNAPGFACSAYTLSYTLTPGCF